MFNRQSDFVLLFLESFVTLANLGTEYKSKENEGLYYSLFYLFSNVVANSN